MTYEIRYQYRYFSTIYPLSVSPWSRVKIKRTRHWWRVRLAGWLDSINRMYPGYPPGSLIGQERKMRVRIIA